MTLSISDFDVRALTRMDRIIQAVEDAALEEHAGMVIMPERLSLMHEETLLRIMPAYLCGSGVFGYKSFHGSMSKGVRYMIVLCREEDGEILALLDGSYLTGVRTGATSAVATKYMAPEGPATLGLIGSGLEATTNLQAVAAVRKIERGWVYSRDRDRRNEFARRTREETGIDLVAVDAPEEAVADASIVVVATNSGYNGPVALRGEWLRAGQHVVSIGATSPFLHELDPATFERADRIVFDAAFEQVSKESGDLVAIDGALRDRLRASSVLLPELVAAGPSPRASREISLFKSVGTAAQDVASAKAIYDLAVERGMGREIGELAAPKVF